MGHPDIQPGIVEILPPYCFSRNRPYCRRCRHYYYCYYRCRPAIAKYFSSVFYLATANQDNVNAKNIYNNLLYDKPMLLQNTKTDTRKPAVTYTYIVSKLCVIDKCTCIRVCLAVGWSDRANIKCWPIGYKDMDNRTHGSRVRSIFFCIPTCYFLIPLA